MWPGLHLSSDGNLLSRSQLRFGALLHDLELSPSTSFVVDCLLLTTSMTKAIGSHHSYAELLASGHQVPAEILKCLAAKSQFLLRDRNQSHAIG